MSQALFALLVASAKSVTTARTPEVETKHVVFAVSGHSLSKPVIASSSLLTAPEQSFKKLAKHLAA